jgi:hypothetical protein
MLRSIEEREARQAQMRESVERSSRPGSYYTIQEVAAIFRLSHDKARRLFRNEPGVMAIPGPSGRYVSYRIPAEVVERVRVRLSNP